MKNGIFAFAVTAALLTSALSFAAPGTVNGKVSAVTPATKSFALTESSGRVTNYLVSPATVITVNGRRVMGAIDLKIGDKCAVTADSGKTLSAACTR